MCMAARLKRALAAHGEALGIDEGEGDGASATARQRHNLGCLVGTLLADRALSLSVLKVRVQVMVTLPTGLMTHPMRLMHTQGRLVEGRSLHGMSAVLISAVT